MIRPFDSALRQPLLPVLLVCTIALSPLAAAGAQGGEPVQRPLAGAAGGEVDIAQPISVTARQTGTTEITVTWTAVPGARTYFIGRLAPPAGWQRVNSPTPSATRYVDRNVEAGRSYTYQISAISADGRAGRRFASDSVRVAEGVVATGGGTEAAAEPVVAETREAMLERVYQSRRGGHDWWVKSERLGKPFWLRTAQASGLGEAELTASWKEVAIAAQLYQHIFKRAPTAAEFARQRASQRSGKSWDDQWRELAQSAGRQKEFGSFATSPMSMSQARGLFGFRYDRPGESCFGGLGPGCTGTIPAVFDWVQPRWRDYFSLPDGTEMAYVEIGVAVGSILHDNSCLSQGPGVIGVACSGWEFITDFTKHSGVPSAKEWNKAAWNVMDHRGWRAVFGPYPVDLSLRRRWYDDLRPVPARRAMMANVAGTLTLPIHDQPYLGGERMASRVLSAPPGTTIDGGDVLYCASQRFARTESPIAKAPSGICR